VPKSVSSPKAKKFRYSPYTTRREAADYHHIDVQVIDDYRSAGKIREYRFGNCRKVLLWREDVVNLLRPVQKLP
jgi:hypothetical protein